MNKKFIIISALVVIFFIIMGKDIIPVRIEIDDLEVVDVIGIDTIESGVRISVFRSAPSKDEEDEKDTSKNTSRVVEVEAKNFTDALKLLKTVTDKYISAWNTKYYLIGEETAKSDLKDVEDFLSRNYETSLTAKLYITSGMTAAEFLEQMALNDIDVQENLSNMEEDFLLKNETREVDIVDVIDMYLDEGMHGIIPKILVLESEGEAEPTKKKLDFDGAVVLKNDKAVCKLSGNEMKSYNLSTNNIEYYSFDLKDKEGNSIILGGSDIKVSYKFHFNENKDLSAINMKIKLTCNIEEKHSEYNIYNSEEFDNLKKQISTEITEGILAIIQISKDVDTDIIDLEKRLKYNNPYRYQKIENAWEVLKTLPINIDVECNIDTTYNILYSNSDQKE